MKNLKCRMEEKEKEAVAETEKKCRELFMKEKQQCKESHLVEIQDVEEKIKQQNIEYEKLKEELLQKEKIRQRTEKKLREVVEEFQNFIDLSKGFTKGQSEFLLPDINLLQDMLKGAVLSCRHELQQ